MKKNAIRTLVAAATVSLALVAVGPASAEPNNGTPPPKKSCTLVGNGTTADGKPATVVLTYGHGTKISGNGGKAMTCNDGKWEQTKAFTGPAATFHGTIHVSPDRMVATIG